MKTKIRCRVIVPYGVHSKGDIVTPFSAIMRESLLAARLVEIVRDDEEQIEHAVHKPQLERAVKRRAKNRVV